MQALELEFCSPVNTVKVMLSCSVNLLKLFHMLLKLGVGGGVLYSQGHSKPSSDQ